MILEVVQIIWEAFQGLVSSFLTTDNIFYIGIGFTLLMVVFFFIKSALSYECKLERSVNRLNEWLFKHQTLTESNLIEFNNLIKSSKCPKILRKHWQQYMLYRDKLPSEYMSAYNCIDKPAKTSTFVSNIKNFIAIYKVTAVVTLLLSIISFASRADLVLTYLSIALVTPVIILIIGLVFTLILRTMQNNNLASLYQTFHIFNRYIDKASVTIPKYVDFEILFTKKEIKSGIPILGEYLEKRARQEQEELEEAQRNAISHEEYDFSNSGVDGALVLERAMKESETYLNFKQRTLAEIQQFESEISTLKKNYENTSKDYQRKLQTSKENMERLRQQQEESTNRIEVNYIRKQQQDEVKKQEQLEKDQEDATNKFNAEINSLSAEIEKRRSDLEERRVKVQEAMASEYQTFSVKLHKAISSDVEKTSDEVVQKISIEKDQYAQAITYLKGEVDNKDAIISAKEQIIEELQNRISALENGEYVQTHLNVEQPTEEQYEVEDYTSEENADEQYEIEDYTPEESTEENAEEQYEVEDYTPEENADEQYEVEDYTPEESSEEYEISEYIPEGTQEQVHEDKEEEIDNEPHEETQESEAPDGHYDEKGYYWFNDKTYYDADGLYHDLEGNVYDSEGNLQATNQIVEVEAEENKETAEIEMSEYAHENNEVSNFNPFAAQSQEQAEETDDFEVIEYNPEEIQEAKEIEIVEEAEDAENTSEQENAQPKRGRGRPRKEVSEDVVSTEPKRGRGRPKKETTEKEDTTPKRKAGRPKKEVSEKLETTEPKRGRGRPKKEPSEELKTTEPKRGRGRPRKEVTDKVETTEPKRGRGRPKKETTEKEDTTPKRKAGRPKKSESTEPHIDLLKRLGQSLLDASETAETPKKRSAKKS